MSESQYGVLPMQGRNGQLLQSDSTANVSGNDQLQEQMAQSQLADKTVAQTIRRNNEAAKQKESQEKEQTLREKQASEHPSLVKQVTSDPSVLYSFINWDNPGRTLVSLVTVMSLIISTRYFSPIQWILKISCIVLGATSLVELVGGVATKDGIMARVRPKSYYRPSERTYSRLFSELGEVIDMTSVKLQKIVFAEDLRGTGIAFALSFIAYWLVKAIPPFWLAITATLLTYTLGPILTRKPLDPNAPSMKPVIDRKAQNLKNSVVDTASSATNRVANTAQDLSSQAMNTASSATDRVAGTAQDLKNRTIATSADATDYTANMAQDLKNRTTATASAAADHTASTAQDLKNSANDSAAHTADRGQGLKTRYEETSYSTTDPKARYEDIAYSTTDPKTRYVETAHSTTDPKTRYEETAYSTTDPVGARDYGAGRQYAGSQGTALRNTSGFDQNGLPKDRRTEFNPLEPGSANITY